MDLSKCKRWRVLLHRVIAKQQAKSKQSHPVCLLTVEKEVVNETYCVHI